MIRPGSPVLAAEQLVELAGGYRQPSKQLAELHRRGFWRAARSPKTGKVMLEVAHYEAVSAGATPAAPSADQRPAPLKEPRFTR